MPFVEATLRFSFRLSRKGQDREIRTIMKILLVKAFPKLTSVGLLAKQLKKLGHDVHLLVPSEHPDCEDMRRLGIPVHVFDFSAPARSKLQLLSRGSRILAKMIRLFRQNDFDVIHLNLWRSRVYGRIASLFARRAVVISSIRGMEARQESATNWMDDSTVAVSETVRKFLLSTGLPERKVVTIRNGVDLEEMDRVARDPHFLHRELGLDPATKLIGMVAFFRSYVSKGHKFFMEAAQILAARRDDIAFVLVGGNAYNSGFNRQYCERFAAEAGISGRVHFTGERADVPAIMSSLSVNVLPSLKEGCPMVILEAMARGTPNVASRIDSISEIIQHEGNGVMFEPGNPSALAGAIGRLLDDPERAMSIGVSGRKRVESAYSAAEMGRRYEKLYRSLMASRSPRWAVLDESLTENADGISPRS